MSKIGGVAQKFFVESFEKKGFTDKTFEAWEADEDSKGGELMVKTGALKNSIKVDNVTKDSVTIVSDVDYASYQNDGTGRIPARPFMKESETLEKQIEKIIEADILKIINK